MSEFTWIIGSDENCDTVVDQPSVSGKHCRLTLTGDKYTLEDMQSTNGTFVNGSPIDGPVGISRADTVTLGKSTPLPWPAENGRSPADKIILIGAADNNDVVIHEAVVSGQHARLIQRNRQWFVEDLGSTNGTFVGTPDNRVEKAPVTGEDSVFFGSHQVRVRDLLPQSAAAVPMTAKEYIDEVSRPTVLNRHGTKSAMCAAAAVVVPVLFFVGYQLLSSSETEVVDKGNAPAESDSGDGSEQPNGHGSSLPVAAKDTEDDNQPTNTSPASDNGESTARMVPDKSTTQPTSTTKATVPEIDPLTSSMFQLIIGNNNPKPAEGNETEEPSPQLFRVASAWPVQNDLLITSAYAIRSMNDFDEKQLPDRLVCSMVDGKQYEIAAVGMHPQYKQAREVFLNSVKTYKQIQETTGIGSSADSNAIKLPEGRDADQIAKQYKAAKLAGEQAYRVMALTNVGWIRLAKPLSDAKLISLKEKTGTIRPKQQVHMFGAMFGAEDPYFDPAAKAQCFRVAAAVLTPQMVDAGGPRRLWMLNSRQNWHQLNAEGCVVVDPNGDRFLGMYSQPTSSPENSSQDGRFQIVEAKTIREMLAGL